MLAFYCPWTEQHTRILVRWYVEVRTGDEVPLYIVNYLLQSNSKGSRFLGSRLAHTFNVNLFAPILQKEEQFIPILLCAVNLRLKQIHSSVVVVARHTGEPFQNGRLWLGWWGDQRRPLINNAYVKCSIKRIISIFVVAVARSRSSLWLVDIKRALGIKSIN